MLENDYTIPTPPGLVIAFGFGVKIHVKDNHLMVSDGIGDFREARRFNRATGGLLRLIVLSTSGSISLDAIQWLHDVGAGLSVIGYDGTLLLADGPRRNTPDLRRAQLVTGQGLEIARDLIAAKLDGQIHTLRYLGADDAPVRRLLPALAAAGAPEEIRLIEAQAASWYWQAWRAVPVRFVGKAVPEHWRSFGPRVSHVTHTPRRASTPANALLNYAYAVLAGEARLEALALGFEPAWGFLHGDDDALVYDVIEPARPAVDRWLYEWLEHQVFTPSDFMEDRQGVVRIAHPLRRLISAHAFHFREWVTPVLENIARQLNPQAALPRRRAVQPGGALSKLARCRECGVPVSSERAYCEDCLTRHDADKLARFIDAGAQASRVHGGDSGRRRGKTNRQHQRANAETSAEQIRAVYRWEAILPAIQTVPVRALARQTGLSLRYVSLIRRGLKTPHPRHWPAFAQASEDFQTED